MKGKETILYVGLSNYPLGLAMVEKVRLISKALLAGGFHVIIINQMGLTREKSNRLNEEIEYDSAYTTKNRSSFIKKKFIHFLMPFFEWNKLNEKYLIVNSRNIFHLIIYYYFCKVYNIKLLITSVEYGSVLKTNGFLEKKKQLLFEKFAFKLVDAAFPRSDFLAKKIKNKNKNLPILKIPVLTDFEYINKVDKPIMKRQFLFCGGAAFYDLIDFIINSFDMAKIQNISLILNCGGSHKELRRLSKRITKAKKSKYIKLTNGLSFERLIENYKSSLALLIPLRYNLQDLARFPHKIGEYAASGRPIISNDFGEMNVYFKDGETAFLADEYTPKSIAAKMELVANNQDLATTVGQNAKLMASAEFNYINYIKKLKEFLNSI